MWSLLRTRRWIAFSLLVVIAIVGFGLLSRWQWQRAEDRRTERLALDAVATQDVTPVDLAVVDPVEWEPIVATGRYAEGATWLIRQRPLDGANGFWVVSLLQTNTAEVWVNRGWIPSGASATAAVTAPAPPTGDVMVTGRLRWSEMSPDPFPTDLPSGQAPALDPVVWGRGEESLYLEATTSVPRDPGLTTLPAPVIDEGRNISYAVQWVIFAVIALVGWFYFLRREAREDAAAEAETP
jgi:cytochrome oxidase assembly protein ShyY1